MEIAVLGAHGQIARQLTRLLNAGGHGVRGIIRNPDQSPDIEADGATPVVCDLEHADPAEVDAALAGTDVVVFAAGAGPGSGAGRKDSMDRDGAIKAVDSAGRVGVARFVMVSAIHADQAPDDDEVFSIYLRAKAAADEALRRSGLDHLILRPGSLTDDPPTGQVHLAPDVGGGSIPRADVAQVLAAAIALPWTGGRTLELVSGPIPIADAVATTITT